MRPIKREPHKPKIAEGRYNAVIKGVEEKFEQETAFGLKDQIWLTFDLDGVEIQERYTRSNHENSKLGKVIAALFGDIPNPFQPEDLQNQKCVVKVEWGDASQDGSVWEHVKRVFAPSQTFAPEGPEDDADDETLLD